MPPPMGPGASQPMRGANMPSNQGLVDALRQIYQLAQRHLPVPGDVKLDHAMMLSLERIAKEASAAVSKNTKV